jgi:hypothetical protein
MQTENCTHEHDCECLVDSQEPLQAIQVKWEYRERQSPRWGIVTREGLIVGRGRNQRVVPPDDVYKLAAFGCTDREMAQWFQIKEDTLRYNFAEYIEKGRADLKHRLRSAQVKLAIGGNATMLIWLGKQYLGQSDTPTGSEQNQPLPWTE